MTPSAISEGTSTAVLFSPPIIYHSFSKSRLAPDSFKGSQSLLQSKPHISSPRPHVWGFFFHFRLDYLIVTVLEEVFVPMFGDSFSQEIAYYMEYDGHCFRPHVWGFFFHKEMKTSVAMTTVLGFRPHVWGFFFHRIICTSCFMNTLSFRPHVWGFFFHDYHGNYSGSK